MTQRFDRPRRGAILHRGPYQRLFGNFPERMARVLDVPITDDDSDVDLGFVLAWDDKTPPRCPTFIPFETVASVHDKREQVRRMVAYGVSLPESHLFNDFEELKRFVAGHGDRRWLLKFPSATSGTGHQVVTPETRVTPLWSAPYLLQEFIALEDPCVYRLYGIAGEIFGFNVRRFSDGEAKQPIVSLSTGAHYELAGTPPKAAVEETRRALESVDLLRSFGCVDFLLLPGGDVRVVEVNTDGLYQYVLRVPMLPTLEAELDERFRAAFHAALAEVRP
jgi:hypothetical protein